MNKAIETLYEGQLFRSRLEARWAAFFDALNWRWEYEPFDLDGYIPDFVLRFHEPLLVEVKPAMSIDQLLPLANPKLETSGWNGPALVVGACLFPAEDGESEGALLGKLRTKGSPYQGKDWIWDGALLQRNEGSHAPMPHYGLCDELLSYRCRVDGCYDGNQFAADYETVQRIWRVSSNLVRWTPRAQVKPR